MKHTMNALCLAVSTALFLPAVHADSPEWWFEHGQQAVEAAKQLHPNNRPAKNVILFVADGMGISTVTAARILEGQLRGEHGEENLLSFEHLPHVALSKTYNTNQQTPDSAGTMTAMVTGIKTKAGIISANQHTVRGDCASMQGNELESILKQVAERGLATGVVSTARLTHATPATNYAHSPDRNWEDDRSIPAAEKAAGCKDIASQLIEFSHGDGIQVALGGGRRHFLPQTMEDPEYMGSYGRRQDGRDLTAEWTSKDASAAYVWNKEQFDAIDTDKVSYLLGLFEPSHMQYEHDRPMDTAGEPSLTDMTAKAIDVLSRNEKGYYLQVESGRVDHAHHASNSYRALTDAIELANAVKAAMEKTDPRDTMIIVTADHSHVFTIAGYATRGNDIMGKVVSNDSRGEPRSDYTLDGLGLPYTTLSYANGPGYTGASSSQVEGPKTYPHRGRDYAGISMGRPDLTWVNTSDPSYMQEATVPLSSETHSGEDVAIYAGGPMAHLFQGVVEQNVIYHVMAEALRINKGDDKHRKGDHKHSKGDHKHGKDDHKSKFVAKGDRH